MNIDRKKLFKLSQKGLLQKSLLLSLAISTLYGCNNVGGGSNKGDVSGKSTSSHLRSTEESHELYSDLSFQVQEYKKGLDEREFKNQLSGGFGGMVYFAQTHVTNVEPRSYDPKLIPNRDSLILLLPESDIVPQAINIMAELPNGEKLEEKMSPPQELKFGGRPHPVEGKYKYTERAWFYKLPYKFMQPGIKIKFQLTDQANRQKNASLKPKPQFSVTGYEVVNNYLYMCWFGEKESECFNEGDPRNPFSRNETDEKMQKMTNQVAARETFSQYPVTRLINGGAHLYIPYIFQRVEHGKKIAKLFKSAEIMLEMLHLIMWR